MNEIDIGDLSSKVGLSTATIRFYESKGFIQPMGRKGLRRQYPLHTVQTLMLIKLLKNSGLSLKDIQKIFINNTQIHVNRDEIEQASIQIEQKISDLKKLMLMLEHIKSCPYEDHISCPSFIEMLNQEARQS